MLNDILSRIAENDIVRLAQDLIKIPSVNPLGNEEDVSYFLAEKMRDLGFRVETYEVEPKRPNVIGTLSGSKDGRSIMFNGHMDVVPVGDLSRWTYDPFGGEIHGGRIYGRGSTDMKGGIASMLVAMKALVDSSKEFSGKLIFTGVMDEESEGLGTRSIVERGYRAEMAVIGEPSDGLIYRGHKGSLFFEVITSGTSKHSSQVSSKSSANAIYRMVRVVRAIEEMLPDLEKRGDGLLGNPTISVGEIEGGTKPNIVPEKCRIVVDRRILPDEDPHTVLNQIRRSLLDLSKDDPEFSVDVNEIISREGAIVSNNSEIVKIASQAIGDVSESTPRISGMKATTDMAFLVKAGIPTIIYGPGSIQQAHVTDEFIDIDQLLNAARAYASILSSTLTPN